MEENRVCKSSLSSLNLLALEFGSFEHTIGEENG